MDYAIKYILLINLFYKHIYYSKRKVGSFFSVLRYTVIISLFCLLFEYFNAVVRFSGFNAD